MVLLNKHLEQVKEFHEVFEHPISETIVDLNTVSDELKNLRINLIQEELNELKEALSKNDIVGVADALTDLQYVLDGAYLVFGLHKHAELLSDEVHSSNMSKLGEDGKPIKREDGKIMKGKNFREPNLKEVLKYATIEAEEQEINKIFGYNK